MVNSYSPEGTDKPQSVLPDLRVKSSSESNSYNNNHTGGKLYLAQVQRAKATYDALIKAKKPENKI